jgi:ATP-dependent 26S proteasome regulatory subunit
LVIEFPPPGAAERRRIWQRALAARANSSEFDFEHLSSLDLSGGAIASVAADAARRALEADAALTMTIILEVARAELLQNSRPGERRR